VVLEMQLLEIGQARDLHSRRSGTVVEVKLGTAGFDRLCRDIFPTERTCRVCGKARIGSVVSCPKWYNDCPEKMIGLSIGGLAELVSGNANIGAPAPMQVLCLCSCCGGAAVRSEQASNTWSVRYACAGLSGLSTSTWSLNMRRPTITIPITSPYCMPLLGSFMTVL
jgi:hypothetical protein